MTWTKLGTEFNRQCGSAGLSSDAYRTHCEAIAWVYADERTSLRIGSDELRMLAWCPGYQQAADELVAARFWKATPDGWQIVHHGDVIRQSLAAQRAQRTRNARAQQAYRKRQAHTGENGAAAGVTVPEPEAGLAVSDAISAYVSAPPRSGQHRTGTNASSGQREAASTQPPVRPPCTACSKPARNGCRTCWDHAGHELAAAS